MNETSLRAQLELAVSAEPPLGLLVGNSLRAGRKHRRRRRTAGAASLSAAAIVLLGAVPALTTGPGHQAGRSRSAAGRHPAAASTAYVATSKGTVVPIRLATNTPGAPIRVPEGMPGPFITKSAASADGRTVYEVGDTSGGATVTSIDTATNTAARPITIKGAYGPLAFMLAPDGKTAYLSSPGGLFQVSLATSTARRVTGCSWSGCQAIALTPNGRALYVISGDKSVIVVRTATNTVLSRIKLPANSPGSPLNIGITPNGKTAYVVDAVAGAKPGTNSVVPINLATNTPLPPIKIWAPGLADGLVIAPGGRTAYVLSSRGVTAIDTATNQAEATISLPEAAGNAYYMVLAPDGKTLYVLTPRGIVPIRTASGTVLPTIEVPHLTTFTVIAITPDSRRIYVGAAISHRASGRRWPKIVTAGVVPVNTATRTVGRFINLGGDPFSIAFGQ